MDALRRAEEAKRLATPGDRPDGPPAAAELRLDPLETSSPAPETPLPPLSDYRESIDADLLATAATSPERRDGLAARRPASADNGEAAARAAAKNVFATKQVGTSRRVWWLIGGLVVVATLLIVGYVWWQLRSVGGGSLSTPPLATPTRPQTPSVAASPPVRPAEAEAPTPLPAAPAESAPRVLPRSASPGAPRADGPRREPARPPQGDAPGVFRPSSSRAGPERPIDQAYDALQANRLDDARRGYEQVLRGDTHNADALLGLAVIAARQGQLERAQQLYLRVLEVDPANAIAQAAVIDLRGQSDPGLAESRLKTLLASQPDSPGLFVALGNLYARQGRWSEAQQAYFQAYVLEPDNADTLFNIAVSLDHLRQGRLAAQYYRMALSAAETRRSVFDQNAVGKRLLELQR